MCSPPPPLPGIGRPRPQYNDGSLFERPARRNIVHGVGSVFARLQPMCANRKDRSRAYVVRYYDDRVKRYSYNVGSVFPRPACEKNVYGSGSVFARLQPTRAENKDTVRAFLVRYYGENVTPYSCSDAGIVSRAVLFASCVVFCCLTPRCLWDWLHASTCVLEFVYSSAAAGCIGSCSPRGVQVLGGLCRITALPVSWMHACMGAVMPWHSTVVSHAAWWAFAEGTVAQQFLSVYVMFLLLQDVHSI